MTTDISVQSSNIANFNPPPPSRDVAHQEGSPSEIEIPSFSDKRASFLNQKLLAHATPRVKQEQGILSEEKLNLTRYLLSQFYHLNSEKIPSELTTEISQLDTEILKKNNDVSIRFGAEALARNLEKFLQKNPFLNTQADKLLKNLQELAPSFDPASEPEIKNAGTLPKAISKRFAGTSSPTNSEKPYFNQIQIDHQLLDFFYSKNGELQPEWKSPPEEQRLLLFYAEKFKKALENSDTHLPSIRKSLIECRKNFLDAKLVKLCNNSSDSPEIKTEEFLAPIRKYINASNNEENVPNNLKLLIDHLEASSFKNSSIAQKVKELKIEFKAISFVFGPTHDLAEAPPTRASIVQDLNAFHWDNSQKFTPKLRYNISNVIHALNNTYINRPLNGPHGQFYGKTNDDQVYSLGKIFINELENFILEKPELKTKGDQLIEKLKMLFPTLKPSMDTEYVTSIQIELEEKVKSDSGIALETLPKLSVLFPDKNSPADLIALKPFDERKGEFDAIANEFNPQIRAVETDIERLTDELKQGYSQLHSQYENPKAIREKINVAVADLDKLKKAYKDKLLQAIALPPGFQAEMTLNYRDLNDPSSTKPYNHDDDLNGIKHAFSAFMAKLKNSDAFPQNIKQALKEIKREHDLEMTETIKINNLPKIREKVLRNTQLLHDFLKNESSQKEAFSHLDSALAGLLDKQTYAKEDPEQRKNRVHPKPSDDAAFRISRTLIPKTNRPFALHVSGNSMSGVEGAFGYRGGSPFINIFRQDDSNADFNLDKPEFNSRYKVFIHEMGHLLASLNPKIRASATQYILKYCEKNSDGTPKIINGYVEGPWSKTPASYIGRLVERPNGKYEAPEVLSEGLKLMLLNPADLYKNNLELFALVYNASRNFPGSVKQTD